MILPSVLPFYSNLSQKHALSCAKLHKIIFLKGWSKKEFLSLFSNPALIASGIFSDSTLIGFCFSHSVKDESEIITFGIHPSFQKKTLGSSLLHYHLEELKKKNSMFSISLEVNEKNTPALKLYTKFGFVPVGKRKDYYASSNSALSSCSNAIILKYITGQSSLKE